MNNTPDPDALLAPLKKKYVENLSAQKEVLEKYLNQLQHKPLVDEQKEELALLGHSLSGSGATYGFQEVTDKGQALEQFLLDNPNATNNEIKTYVVKLIDVFSEIIVTHRSETAAQQGDKEALEKARSQLPLILISDDDEMIRIMLKELLKDIARTIECDTAKAAFKLMKEEKPALVLLDDKMPGGLRGIELLEKIQNTPKISSIPVMVISANNDSKEVLRGLMAGAVDYILKPINPAQVLTRVKERLEKQRASILIADDDVTIRSMLKHKLLSTGCRILLAEEGAEALQSIEKYKPNLVILDQMMPGIDGTEVLRKMRENPDLVNIPVIFLTAKHKEEDVINGLNLGAIDYIVKPFNPALVVSRCMHILERQELIANAS